MLDFSDVGSREQGAESCDRRLLVLRLDEGHLSCRVWIPAISRLFAAAIYNPILILAPAFSPRASHSKVLPKAKTPCAPGTETFIGSAGQ